MSSFERLDPATRDIIVSKCDTPIYDLYAMSEASAIIAFQCQSGEGLHVNSDYFIIEIIDEAGEHVQIGDQGEIVMTSLNSYAMPLIRYRTGDIGTLGVETCACGLALPKVIRSIDGRSKEYCAISNNEWKLVGPLLDRITAYLQVPYTLTQMDIAKFHLTLYAQIPVEESVIQSMINHYIGNQSYLEIKFANPHDSHRRPKIVRFTSSISRPDNRAD